jgi:serine/threonine-protein kinase
VQVCAALAAAHAAGLVHRDVKPQNLILGRDGVLRLGDFGIAAGRDGTQLTVAGTVLGTVGYLAPEQARGEQVTAAADIYAVGAVLYELLTGEPPWTGRSLSELGAMGGFHPPDLAGRLVDVPAELVAAVTACLSVRPEDRPPSAAALARLLAPVASEADTLSMPADPARRATEILAPPDSRPPGRWRTRRLVAAAALLAAAGGGLAAALAVNTGGDASRPPSTPHAVSPPAAGADVVDQAHNLAAWLRRHSG